MKNKHGLIFIGVLLGYVMTFLFLIGYRITFNSGSPFGGFFVGLALALWPLYVVAVFVLTLLYKDKYKATIKALWRSHFFVPVGAVLAILTVPLLYMLLD